MQRRQPRSGYETDRADVRNLVHRRRLRIQLALKPNVGARVCGLRREPHRFEMRFNTSHDRHVGHRSDRPGTASDLNDAKLPSRSVLDCSVRLTGDLWSEGDVQIDGHLYGNISCEQLIVNKDAVVIGVIIAQEAVIRGKTTGIIRATRVLLQETARVESELIYKSLAVDEGASFGGTARPSQNPLAEDFALSSPPEALLSIGQTYTHGITSANWIGADCEASGEAGTMAATEPPRQLVPPTVDTQPP